MNVYIAAHAHHVEGVSPEESKRIIDAVYKHACSPKYVVSIEWKQNGDCICWDNCAVMHRAAGGSFEGKYVRDMRRTTVHDSSIHAWGLNEKSNDRMGYRHPADTRLRG